jgi:hypothetical protein
MPPAVMKRLDEGNWQSSLIMGGLIRFYWKRTRRTDWSEVIKDDKLPLVDRLEQGGLF